MLSTVKKLLHHKKVYLSTMSPPRIFVTGVAGYIGGNLVVDIMDRHPDWNVVTLVRSDVQKAAVLARWPATEVVIGDLDDKALMIDEASKADVIFRE